MHYDLSYKKGLKSPKNSKKALKIGFLALKNGEKRKILEFWGTAKVRDF
jgi:hypothetical protein